MCFSWRIIAKRRACKSCGCNLYMSFLPHADYSKTEATLSAHHKRLCVNCVTSIKEEIEWLEHQKQKEEHEIYKATELLRLLKAPNRFKSSGNTEMSQPRDSRLPQLRRQHLKTLYREKLTQRLLAKYQNCWPSSLRAGNFN